MKYYFSADLGATSGRTIVGKFDGRHIELEEITRFDTPLIEMGGHFYWDILALYNEIIRGLRTVAERGINIESIGIDTWGVDVALFGADGHLLRCPLSYRDPHTFASMEEYFKKKMPRREVYARTGIQVMNFNTLYQLYSMQAEGNSALAVADKILFLPDALSYLLTGEAVCEYTIASTSQMIDPTTKDLHPELLDTLQLRRSQFGRMVSPGTVIGSITPEVQRLTGLGAVNVVAVAGHDTASAIAAVPASNPHFAYLSSGTWSLMGVELPHAVIDERSTRLNFTNEGGICDTIRFLKNICGMWLYERCRKEYPEEIRRLPHPELQGSALEATPFRSLINPDDPCFANPESMIHAIQQYCERTGQPVPETHQQLCRCIFESLALRYRQVLGWLRETIDTPIDVLHIIGGGSRNVVLCQMAADACGITVKTGPQEGTALGNMMLQAKAQGAVDGVWEMRRVVADSVQMKTYEPQGTEAWTAVFERFEKLTEEGRSL